MRHHSLTCFLTATILAGCNFATPQNAVIDDPPPPIPPTWLSVAEVQRLENSSSGIDNTKKLDVFVVMAAAMNDDTKRANHIAGTALLIKYDLHRLFYPVDFDVAKHPVEDPAFYTALSTFERRAGLEVDGVFTIDEFSRLGFLASLEGERRTHSIFHVVSVTDQFASAQGTWTIQGEAIAYPVNKSEIHCWRFSRTCSVFTANLDVRREERSGSTLLTNVDHYDVSQWTSNEVEAVSTSSCRRTTITLNAATKQAYEVTTDVTMEGCPLVGALKAPRVATLEDGFKLTDAFWDKRKEALKGVTKSPMDRIASLMGTPATGQQP
jgi:hypothetical protein